MDILEDDMRECRRLRWRWRSDTRIQHTKDVAKRHKWQNIEQKVPCAHVCVCIICFWRYALDSSKNNKNNNNWGKEREKKRWNTMPKTENTIHRIEATEDRQIWRFEKHILLLWMCVCVCILKLFELMRPKWMCGHIYYIIIYIMWAAENMPWRWFDAFSISIPLLLSISCCCWWNSPQQTTCNMCVCMWVCIFQMSVWVLPFLRYCFVIVSICIECVCSELPKEERRIVSFLPNLNLKIGASCVFFFSQHQTGHGLLLKEKRSDKNHHQSIESA